MNLYLVRHGQEEDNANGILNGHRDIPLTELGLEQSEKWAESLRDAGVAINKIYNSPLKRAFQTAEIFSRVLHVEKPLVMESLIERDFGIMTGKSVKDIKKYCKTNLLKTEHTLYFLSPKKAETFPQLFERAKMILENFKTADQTDSILLVTHGDIGKMIYAAYYQLPWEDALRSFHFDNGQIISLKLN